MKFFKDYRHQYSYEYDGLVIKCTARSWVKAGGKTVPVKGYGEAKCHKLDMYDKEFGQELAKIRAKRELCTKIENVFIDQTKKKSWNKLDELVRLLKENARIGRRLEEIKNMPV